LQKKLASFGFVIERWVEEVESERGECVEQEAEIRASSSKISNGVAV